MRASFLYGGVQLEEATKALRRAHTPEKPKPQPRGRGPIVSPGFLVGFVAMVVTLGWLAWPRTPNADPLGDGRLNNAPAEADPFADPQVRARLAYFRSIIHEYGLPTVGEQRMMQLPDGRDILITYHGQAQQWEDLPWTGNKLGDCFTFDGNFWIWAYPSAKALPIGTIHLQTPTWVDP